MKKLKEKLNAKLSKNGGFTLVEMLIVVAIIAILIAVSIPLVGSALERARNATDAANERAFKGAMVSSYLLNTAGMKENGATEVTAGPIYAFDAVNGKVVAVADAPTSGYGQSTTTKALSKLVLYGYIEADGDVVMGWLAAGSTSADKAAVDGAKGLCISGTITSGT